MNFSLRSSVLALPLGASLLISGCVTQSRYDYLEGQFKELQQQTIANNASISSMQKEMADDKAHIGRLQDAIKYTVNSDLLFPSGSWQMSASGQELISRLAPKLAPFQRAKVEVNGYTDNAPVGPALRARGVDSNEVLSQKRAETVMQYLISQGVKPDMVTAHGFGAADPVAPNNSPQGRAQNRRVEITLAGSGT